jgi:D-3-phosphoglycerate dehydrogenase
MQKNIKIYDKIAKAGLDLFEDEKYNLLREEAENPKSINGILVRSTKLPMELLEKYENLVGIARAGAGLTNLPALDELKKRGIVIFNAPGANANAVAEYAIGLLITSFRHIHHAARDLENGGNPKEIKKASAGEEVAGKTLGIIGLGAIGQLVAIKAIGLSMKVVGYDPYLSDERLDEFKQKIDSIHKKGLDNFEYVDNLDKLLSQSRAVTIHVATTDETRGFINKEFIDKMQPGALLINTARSEQLVIPDVIQAIEERKIMLASDFGDSEEEKTFVEMAKKGNNVIALPHLGASTAEAENQCALVACEKIKMLLGTGNIKNAVNFPDIELEYSGKTRLGIFHQNVPNMISKISGVAGNHDINIGASLDKGINEEISYMLMDLDGRQKPTDKISDEIIEKIVDEIKQIEGVIKILVA